MKDTPKFTFFLLLIFLGLAVHLLAILSEGNYVAESYVSGLSAKHILDHREFPIYFPGRHYGGALVAYIGAILFKIFGLSTLALKSIGLFYSSLWFIIMYLFSKKMLDYWGVLVSFIFVIIPPPLVSLVSGDIEGGAWCSIPLLLLLLMEWSDGNDTRRVNYFLLGLFSGFGLWLTPYMVPVLFTIITLAFIRGKKIFSPINYIIFIAAFCVGYLPALIYEFQHPGAQLFRFAGRVLYLDRSVLSSSNLVSVILGKIVWRISTIPASLIRFPQLFSSLVGFFTTALFILGGGLIFKEYFLSFIKNKKLNPFSILLIFVFWVMIFYSVCIGIPVSRYTLSLVPVAPIFLGYLLSRIRLRSRPVFLILVAALLLNNGYALWQALSSTKIPAYPQLTRWLLSKRMYYGYSDFWVAYPVMFESQEKIVMSPTLFHPTFSDCWPQDTKKVRNETNVVFVINSACYPKAMSLIDESLRRLRISYQKDFLREFVIYSNFSPKVYPEDLNLEDKKS